MIGLFEKPDKSYVFVVDNTTLDVLKACQRKAQYRLIAGVQKSEEEPALRFGSINHIALAYRYRMEAFRGRFDQNCQRRIIKALFTKYPLENEDWRNLAFATALQDAYNSQHLCEEFTIVKHPQTGRPLVECPFAFDLAIVVVGGVTFRIVFAGKIDLVAQFNEGVFVLDHKTTSMLGSTFWAEANMSDQGRGYVVGCQRCLGLDPIGFVINALAYRKPTKTGTAIEFQRQRFFTKEPPGQLGEWETNTVNHCVTFFRSFLEGYFAQNHSSCVNRYQKLCDYYTVCELAEPFRLATLHSNLFKPVTWSPLHTRA